MRNWFDNLFIAAATVITGVLSWLAARYAQKSQTIDASASREIDRTRVDDEHTKTILDGYSDMVDNLREEVTRLNQVIETLRKEQEECERRNDEMASLMLDMQRRLANLEGGQHGR